MRPADAHGHGVEGPTIGIVGATSIVDPSTARDVQVNVEIDTRQGRIVAVDPAPAQSPASSPAHQLDGRGLFLLPGLIDAHAHVSAQSWADPLLLAAGVTSVRDPAAAYDPAPGPLIRLRAGSAIDHGPPATSAAGPLPRACWVADEAGMRREVEAQASAGVDLIKLYVGLPPALVASGIRHAHRLGLPAAGDLQATSWTEAARAGIDFLCHLPWHPTLLPAASRAVYAKEVTQRGAHPLACWLELVELDGPEIGEMIVALLDAGVAVDPTLVNFEAVFRAGDPEYHAGLASAASLPAELRGSAPELAGDRLARLRRVGKRAMGKASALVNRLHRAGVPLLAGTDAPRPWVAPGFSLHRELELLVTAGLSPIQALAAATGGAARALGIAGELGTVRVGGRADLVLLRRDPREQITNLATVEWVIKSGVVQRPHELLEEKPPCTC